MSHCKLQAGDGVMRLTAEYRCQTDNDILGTFSKLDAENEDETCALPAKQLSGCYFFVQGQGPCPPAS